MEIYKIVDTLLSRGSCCVKEMPQVSLLTISFLVGTKVTYRNAVEIEDGYVLEAKEVFNRKETSIAEDLRKYGFRFKTIEGTTFVFIKEIKDKLKVSNNIEIWLTDERTKRYGIYLPDFRKAHKVDTDIKEQYSIEGYKNHIKMLNKILAQIDEKGVKDALHKHGYKPRHSNYEGYEI